MKGISILGSSTGSVTTNLPLAIVTSLAPTPTLTVLGKLDADSKVTFPPLNL